jgi:integrase
VRIRIKYLIEDIDRHGSVRRYVRLAGRSKVRIRGVPGSEDFMAAYQAAIAGEIAEPRQAPEARKGSFRHLCVGYYKSDKFETLDPATRAWQRRALDRIAIKHGGKPVVLMRPQDVRYFRDERKATPAASKNVLKALRSLFGWAVEEGKASHDPTIGIKARQYSSKGNHVWTIDEVAAFERRHPIGTKARLALALLLYTCCRREDVVRLGPQHVRNGRLKYTQAKNEDRHPVDMDIPVHPDLAGVLAATPFKHLTFLVTEYGKARSPKGFGDWFKDYCRQADLPHCSAHGLRHATATRLAERGATPHEIMAITGHKTLREVERYTRTAQQAKLADSAMAKFNR